MVVTDTSSYERVHGHKPCGSRFWRFEFRVNGFWTAGIAVCEKGAKFFAAAEEEAHDRAKKIGSYEVRVCS